MTFQKEDRYGQLWFCHKCRSIVRRIVCPSYLEYRERDKHKKRREKRRGRTTTLHKVWRSHRR